LGFVSRVKFAVDALKAVRASVLRFIRVKDFGIFSWVAGRGVIGAFERSVASDVLGIV